MNHLLRSRLLFRRRRGALSLRLRAVRDLEGLSFSSQDDLIADLRRAAIEALENSSHRDIYSAATSLTRLERMTVLLEIRNWIEQGLILMARAEVLARRSSFDIAHS